MSQNVNKVNLAL